MFPLREVISQDPDRGLVHLPLLLALVRALLCRDHFRSAARVPLVLLLALKGTISTRTSRWTKRNLLRAYRSVWQMARGCRVG